MRLTRIAAGALLAGVALTGIGGGTATADSGSASPSPDPSASGAPTSAGTSFRTATPVQQGTRATADASVGDYLYWVFPADSGQTPTVRATVTFPDNAAQQGATTWQLDVYDGLRRHQSCRYGMATRAAVPGSGSLQLACTLRTVRAWAEPWSNDPLRGGYYVRLTAVQVAPGALGLPVSTSVEATSKGTGGAESVDGTVAPLVSHDGANVRPSDGWSSTWWSARWLWTAAGGALGALAGIGGYRLTRGSGRPRRVPREV